MKIVLLLLISLNLYAQNNYDYESNFGFLSRGTLLANFKDAQTALSDWIESTAKEDNGKVDVFYYADSHSLYNDYKKNKLNMIVLELDFFFKNKDEIKKKSNNYWTLVNNETVHSQYYLIANKSLNVKELKSIKNTTVSIKKYNLSSEIWFDKISLLENKKSYKNLVKKVNYKEKESSSLLDVFFKKSQFAVISKSTWDIMIELNPSIKKRVEVIRKSKKIHYPFIGLFSNNASEKGLKAFFRLSENIKGLKRGEQIINLLKFDSVHRIDENSLNALNNFYSEYFELQKKYK